MSLNELEALKLDMRVARRTISDLRDDLARREQTIHVYYERAKHSERLYRALRKACLRLLDYRERVGPLNFQLEKADDFINAIRNEVTENIGVL